VAVKLGYRNVYRDPIGFPEWQQMGLPIVTSPAGLTTALQSAAAPADASPLKGWAMLWTLLGVFAGGLALNLTPCVYPMIPITVSFFGGRSARDQPGQRQLVLHGLCYLLGLCLTNASLGVAAALTGGLMGAALQNPIVLTLVAGALVVFATSLFGFWELRLPGALNQLAGKSYGGYFGSLFMGLTLGVVAAPCIGPFVLGLLTWVAGMGSPWLGFVIFFTLSIGLGLPLFVLALFSGQLQRLPRAGGWMLWVRNLMGWVLVGMAVYFIRPVLPEAFKILLPVAVALAAGLHLGWLDKNQSGFRAFPWLKIIVGIACLVMATFWATSWAVRGPGVAWQPYSDALLQEAKVRKKPVIIDFYADWCAPCREFEAVTFHHPEVVRQAKADFVMIKVDVTRGGDPLHERLVSDYEVKGVPTIVFLDAQGGERKDLRLVDYLPPAQFLNHMTAASAPKPADRHDPQTQRSP
jgi:thioredoxin:protein disulfide reductase